MEYKFRDIERKWQERWNKDGAYRVSNDTSKPKHYVLDMFPYPSGAGLHVGHPLGYIASDVYARFKRLKGFNVLHPMGYDAFGLPAEQYAIEHGVHPAVATEQNINNFRRQLDNIGFSYDWSREVRTSDPTYYRWTQWIFLQLFNSWYNRKSNRTEPIRDLVALFEKQGNASHPFPNATFRWDKLVNDNHAETKSEPSSTFSADHWRSFDEKTRHHILMEYRVAYCGYGEVNWCEALGTVLANDEVVNGVSERGGYPVVKRRLRQWYLRITEYADRLLEGLQRVEYSEAMKEMQGNWIGKSVGAEISFEIDNSKEKIKVYTTRPDTIFGVDFMVLAPEHEIVQSITTNHHKKDVEEYVAYVKSRSERDRMAEKKISGVCTGGYALHPFNGKKIPVWISEYVLAGYGTGAIMAVPSGDERDHKFAKHFGIPVTNIFGDKYTGEEAVIDKQLVLYESEFLNGLQPDQAISLVVEKLEGKGIGRGKTNYKIRDAAFSRQRYWGEPIPIVWKDGIAIPLNEKELPLELPHIESYSPGPEGEGPLSNVREWMERGLETNTMPGYAGSSWYFLRYMDPNNNREFCNRKIADYWKEVDLYVGGTEHAVGHLLYSRMWTKALFDLGHISFDEPYRKLLNQGKIGGDSRLVYRIRGTNQFVSAGLKDQHETDELHVDVHMVNGLELDVEAFKKWRPDYAKASFLLENEKYICGTRLEKMSKRYFNVVNPDDVVERYGADTFRMYEMFLGPIDQDKPWDTKGIEGVHRFLKKLWRLFADEQIGLIITDAKALPEELKILHRTIKKIQEDTERFSFNTAVSAFMVCVNELTELKCNKREILEPLLIVLAAYAPHVSEELWHLLGNKTTILQAPYPRFEERFLIETSKEYPVSINGKMRTQISIDLAASQQQVEEIVLSNEVVQKWMEGKPLKKIIYVKGKMVNVVV